MQAAATTNSNTAATTKTTTTKKLSTINAASVNNAATTTTTNNHNKNNNSIIKTRVLQKQPQHGALNSNASAAQPAATVEPTNEIEELSKKITEHADALYRTWRIRGLAPTELPEIYKNTAAAGEDFFVGGAVAAAGSTEGLQQLVNTFVIKDKEQRGVKLIGSGGVGGGAGASDNKTMMKKSTSTEVVKTHIKKPAGQKATTTTTTTSKVTTTALRAKSPTTSTAATTIAAATTTAGTKATASTAAVTTPTVTTKITNAKNDACAFINKKFEATPTPTSMPSSTSLLTPTTVTPKKSMLSGAVKTAQSTSPILDVNLNFDLNLLTKQQTENLLKISELLHKEQQKECEKMAAEKRKPKERKMAATAATNATASIIMVNASAQEHLENGTSAAAAAVATTTKVLKSATTKTTDKTIGNSKLHKNNNNTSSMDVTDALGGADAISKSMMPTMTTTITTTAAAALATDKNSVASNNKRATAQKLASPVVVKAIIDEENQKLTNAKLIKATSKVIVANTTNTTPEASVSVKTTRVTKDKPSLNRVSVKVREKASGSVAHTTANNNNSSSKQSVIGIIGNTANAHGVAKTTATTTASTTTLNGTLADGGGASSSMEVARTTAAAAAAPAATTMPTLNKVKPTSGRAVLTNGQEKNLGRPILTRGSVAERVLMFEKCPDVRNSFLNIKRPDPTDTPPKNLLKVKLHSTPPQPQDHTSLQREIRTTKSVYIPRFYFPHGKPQPTIAMERVLRGILSAFDSFPNNQVTKDELPQILKLCGLPFYWRMPVMVFCQQTASGLIERQRFVEFWKQMNVYCHEAASRFVYILSRGQRFRSYIVPEDLVPLVQDVVDTHPGLAFLKEATEFHSRYVLTVIARIFYSVNRSWSGKITISELKKSDLLEIITLLEEEDDINQIMAFFSYEHFYVIYCKFWELDKDHDLLISQEDLAGHSDHALSTRIVERIFSGCVTRSDNKKSPNDEMKMSYTDFVWFILSEEDKRSPTAIEYWFRCMDIDGDGALSMYELEYFYEEQQQRMEGIGIECLPFEDCLCQMLDMIKPQRRDCITLSDLKHCKMTHVFFDTFFNLEKYLDHEQRDPFASQRDEYSSDWDRFAAQEYELLITEEND